MAFSDSVEAREDAVRLRQERFGSWKFWLIALLLHVLFLVAFAHLYVFVVKPQQALESRYYAGIEVTAPVTPPKLPVHHAPPDRPPPDKPAADFTKFQPVITTAQPDMPAWAPTPIPPVVPSAPPAMNIPSVWEKRMTPDKKRWVPDPAIEDAVLKALRWLKANQNPDGSWGETYATGMTGLALLAFLAHGETHTSREFGEAVRKGLDYLIPLAERGQLTNIARTNHGAYEHGIATYAMAEAYGMTKDPRLKEPLEKCIQTIIDGQTKGGGWIYGFNTDDPFGDMSISGWQIQAMKAAYLAGIMPEKISTSLDKAMEYAKNVYNPTSQGFGYRSRNSSVSYLPGRNPERKIMSLTGTGVLCLQFWNNADAAETQEALRNLSTNLIFEPVTDGGRNDLFKLYGYYYATQALFLSDGPHGRNWMEWDGLYRKALIATQNDDGSFPPCQAGAAADNLVFGTTLATLMLEVWYRNDPSGLNITVLKQGQK